MSEFTFSCEQSDEDLFTLKIEGDSETIAFGSWRMTMSTRDTVALYEALEAEIGQYVWDMRSAKREHDAQTYPDEVGFEGVGDFNSDDPLERYKAHQAAKGRL